MIPVAVFLGRTDKVKGLILRTASTASWLRHERHDGVRVDP
jgi:hypothetical protein